jgi:hypothetical protein
MPARILRVSEVLRPDFGGAAELCNMGEKSGAVHERFTDLATIVMSGCVLGEGLELSMIHLTDLK